MTSEEAGRGGGCLAEEYVMAHLDTLRREDDAVKAAAKKRTGPHFLGPVLLNFYSANSQLTGIFRFRAKQ